jgi:hypothetical protein
MPDKANESTSVDKDAQTPPKDTRATPPRGNPSRDHESVEKGEEQLDRIAGN